METQIILENLNSIEKKTRQKELTKFYKSEKDKWIYSRMFREKFATLDETQRHDVFHEVFIKIWIKIGEEGKQYPTLQKFYAYFSTCLNNKCIDWTRRRTFYYGLPDDRISNINEDSLSMSTYISREAQELTNETVSGLLDYLRSVNFTYYQVVNLIYKEKMKREEVASTLGLTVNTVNTYHRNAKRILREKLQNC